MIENVMHLLSELGELAHMSSGHRRDLERALELSPELGGISSKTILEWSTIILSIASRGITECPLTLNYPNPERLPLAEMKPIIQNRVHDLFAGTPLRVGQFNGWEVRRSVANGDPHDLYKLPDISIEVHIGISWRRVP